VADLFQDYVAAFEALVRQGGPLSDAELQPQSLPELAADAPVCLVFSPHPDDEVIAGALPWRLRTTERWRVVNVAVTLGSRHDRRAQRWRELERSCDYLGFDLVSVAGEPGAAFEQVLPRERSVDPDRHAAQVARVEALIRHYRPRVVVCPHALDGHPAHIGTHDLVMDALLQLAPPWRLHLLLSEYWNTQMQPALMLELGQVQVAALVAALTLHVGEVARNPYHLSLPACFIDAARRGAERVGPPGGPASGSIFAALYGWQRWQHGQAVPMPARVAPAAGAIAGFFA